MDDLDLRTSEEWATSEKYSEVYVTKYSGWENCPWDTPIIQEEFEIRLSRSKVKHRWRGQVYDRFLTDKEQTQILESELDTNINLSLELGKHPVKKRSMRVIDGQIAWIEVLGD